ncbi:hypothetical protein QYE76_048985 [Lolium multiflorum]|uniref:TF-B3 domain-containing protein n=1 Tax=Lolium multiflorum TaxID=4521 RepID=A0AAD8SM73_LOLMU|nr:hypothetical protein QYE76_048985 [Lolium multiflorum]
MPSGAVQVCPVRPAADRLARQARSPRTLDIRTSSPGGPAVPVTARLETGRPGVGGPGCGPALSGAKSEAEAELAAVVVAAAERHARRRLPRCRLHRRRWTWSRACCSSSSSSSRATHAASGGCADSFAEYVAAAPHTMHLREAACDYYLWIIDVIYDARGKMYLNIGWEKFARHHSLEAGFILLFSYLVRGHERQGLRRDALPPGLPRRTPTRRTVMMKSVVSLQRIRTKFLDVRLSGRTNKGAILPLDFWVGVPSSVLS